MFQVAFSIYLARHFNVRPVYVDFSFFTRVRRPVEVECFGVKSTDVGFIKRAWIALVIVLRRRVNLPVGVLSLSPRILDESKGGGDVDKLKICPDIVIGYWQKPLYFSSVENDVYKKFIFPSIPKRCSNFRSSDNYENKVAIHVRRGDYISDPVATNKHLVCDVSWYQKAWRYLRKRVPECEAMVFSDDIGWACENLQLEGAVDYFINVPDCPSWVDMAEMAKYNHFIISNSSFSWWSAYLGSRNDSIVVAPKYWYRNVLSRNIGVCPRSWVLL